MTSDSGTIFGGRKLVVLAATAEILIPEGGAIPYDSTDIDLQGFATQFIATGWQNRFGLVAALFVIEWLMPLLLARRPGRFSRLPADIRREVLQAMHHSKVYLLRGLLLLVNTVVQMAFYSDTRISEYIGYSNHNPGVNIVDQPQGATRVEQP